MTPEQRLQLAADYVSSALRIAADFVTKWPAVLVVAALLLALMLLVRLIGAIARGATTATSAAALMEAMTMTTTINGEMFAISVRVDPQTALYFAFKIERLADANYRVNILQTLNYNDWGRADGPHETHRYGSGSQRFICWNTPISTLEQAKAIAKLWSKNTVAYCLTGAQF